MWPILTRYGSFLYYSYTAVMGVGLLLALGVATRRRVDGQGAMARGGWLNGVIVALLAGLVVGRAAFVAANWAYYADNLDESWLLWQGGSSYHGAVGAGLLALWLWSRLRGVSFARLGDRLALPMALWSVFGWLACYLDGCVYGRETFIGPLSADLPDSFGVFAVRYQTQLMGLLFSLLALGVLWWVWRRWQLQAGILFWLALFLLSAGRAVVDVFRGDAAPVLGAGPPLSAVRLDLLLDAGMAVLAGVALVVIVARDGISRVDLKNRRTIRHYES